MSRQFSSIIIGYEEKYTKYRNQKYYSVQLHSGHTIRIYDSIGAYYHFLHQLTLAGLPADGLAVSDMLKLARYSKVPLTFIWTWKVFQGVGREDVILAGSDV